MTFETGIRELINKHNQENDSNTPDFILAQYLDNCLKNFNISVQQRETWYGRNTQPTCKTQNIKTGNGGSISGRHYSNNSNIEEIDRK